MQKYDSYKDSGVQWLGEIPNHWEIKPGRTIFSENKMKNTALAEEVVLSLSYGKIIEKQNKNDGLVPEEYSSYQIIEPGFIIVRCTDLQNDHVSLRTAISELHGIITSAYLALIPNNSICPKYFHYFFRNWDNTKELYRYGSGLRQSLSWNDFKYLLCVLPPLSEQSVIAAYLDEQTARIDTAIAQQQKMIDLLNERKQIIINRAVTKGLDSNAKMKDSGVEWIGEVPEGWEVKKLKHVCKAFGRIGFRGYSTTDLVDEGEGCITLSPSNMRGGRMQYDKCTYLSWEKYEESPEIKIFDGDILFVKTGSTYGKCSLVENLPIEATINPQLLVFKEFQCSNKFLINVLLTNLIKYQVEISVIGGTIPTISQSKIMNYIFPCPPREEQEKIVQFIDETIAPIDDVIKAIEKQISLLQERKRIIINEVVTGKVKVSNN